MSLDSSDNELKYKYQEKIFLHVKVGLVLHGSFQWVNNQEFPVEIKTLDFILNTNLRVYFNLMIP